MSQQSPASSRSSRSSAKSKAPPADPYGFLSLTLTPDTETADHALDATSCVIGRAPQANLRINLPHISASHCVVRQEGSRVMLMDVSTNGTFVNGDVVGKSLEVELREGDEVSFSKGVRYPRLSFRHGAATNTQNSGPPAKRTRTGGRATAAAPGVPVGEQGQGGAMMASELMTANQHVKRVDKQLEVQVKELASMNQKLQEAKALLEERNTELQATKDELAAEKAAAAKAATAKAAEHEAAVAAKESECAKLRNDVDDAKGGAEAARKAHEKAAEGLRDEASALAAKLRRGDEERDALKRAVEEAQALASQREAAGKAAEQERAAARAAEEAAGREAAAARKAQASAERAVADLEAAAEELRGKGRAAAMDEARLEKALGERTAELREAQRATEEKAAEAAALGRRVDEAAREGAAAAQAAALAAEGHAATVAKLRAEIADERRDASRTLERAQRAEKRLTQFEANQSGLSETIDEMLHHLNQARASGLRAKELPAAAAAAAAESSGGMSQGAASSNGEPAATQLGGGAMAGAAEAATPAGSEYNDERGGARSPFAPTQLPPAAAADRDAEADSLNGGLGDGLGGGLGDGGLGALEPTQAQLGGGDDDEAYGDDDGGGAWQPLAPVLEGAELAETQASGPPAEEEDEAAAVADDEPEGQPPPPLQLGASSSEPSRVASRVASQISGDDAAMEVSAADDGAESQLMLQPHQQMETCMYDDNDDDEEHNEDEAAMAETEAQD